MRRLLLLIALTAACGGGTTPPEPTMRPVAIRTCVPGATVRIGDVGVPATADGFGDHSTNIPGEAFNLHLSAEGYPLSSQVVTFTHPGPVQFLLGSCVPLTDPGLQTVLTPWQSLRPDTGERGAVKINGLTFRRADNSIMPWRGFTAFQLYLQWLKLGPGQSFDTTVTNWLTCGGYCPPGKGPNVLRVLGMVDSFAHLWPQEHGERYYEQLKPFADYLWTGWHARIEFVIFADAQIIMPGRAMQNTHAERVLQMLLPVENVFLEIANEPFKNLPGGGRVAFEIGKTLQARGPPIASGDYDEPWLTQLDYITVHTSRDNEWPRKVKDLLDIRDGPIYLPNGGASWRSNRPVVGDEPIGFAETDRPGSRSVSPQDAAHYAAACAMFSAGCTFHSDAGIVHGPLGVIQAAAAKAFFGALTWVPVEAQLAQYRRGGEEPGCRWAGGESLVEHDDRLELRSFGKQIGDRAWAVQIRSTRSNPTPCGGWKILEQPQAGLIALEQ